jgi:hypothetical protein
METITTTTTTTISILCVSFLLSTNNDNDKTITLGLRRAGHPSSNHNKNNPLQPDSYQANHNFSATSKRHTLYVANTRFL